MPQSDTTDDFDDDDLPIARSGGVLGGFDEFLELDGKDLGADPDELRVAFAAGAGLAAMILGSRASDASADTGGSLRMATIEMLITDLFGEVNELLEGDGDD